jgi:hypothetical protein
MNKNIVPIKMRRIVKGDEVFLPHDYGSGRIVEQIECLSSNIRLTFTNGTTLMRGKDVRMLVCRDMAFYQRSREILGRASLFIATTDHKSRRSSGPFTIGLRPSQKHPGAGSRPGGSLPGRAKAW